jgi:hypothetical protein
MGKLKFVLVWYGAMVCSLIFALLFLTHMSFTQKISSNSGSTYKIYKALPTMLAGDRRQEVEIARGDGRALMIENFFAEYKAPLSIEAGTFVEVADRYGLDYRLLPAIAMQESNGGKRIPKDSNNPFGYGVYGNKIMKFETYGDAINTVGRGLKENYINIGLKTPYQIMTKYTPPSLAKGGPWAIGVSTFMEELL